MKLFMIITFISLLAGSQTVNAIPGIRYLRSSLDNINSYSIRDTAPDSKNANTSSLSNPTDDTNDLSQVAEKLKSQPQNGEKPLRRNTLPETLQPTDSQMPENEPYYHDDSADAEMIPQASPVDNFKTGKPNNKEYPSRRGDDFAFSDLGSYGSSNLLPQVGSSNLLPQVGSSNLLPQNAVSPTALNRLKQFTSLTSVLANIARIPRVIALQIDSVIAGLQKTYPTDTNVGAYMMGTRFLLRNQGALRPFDMMDRAGFGRLDELVSSMPSIFNPIINAMERVTSAIASRSAAVLQRFSETARRVSERASRSLAGLNVARNNDSYSVSVPNVIDMVLKGHLAQKLDELFAYVRRLFSSGLSSVGSSFVASDPVVSDTVPVRNPVTTGRRPSTNPQYQMRTIPRFSTLRRYRPSRYFNEME